MSAAVEIVESKKEMTDRFFYYDWLSILGRTNIVNPRALFP